MELANPKTVGTDDEEVEEEEEEEELPARDADRSNAAPSADAVVALLAVKLSTVPKNS